MFNLLKDSRGMGKITVIIIILIIAASIYVGKKIGKHYYAYYDLKRTMDFWTDQCLTRTSYDHANLVSNVMDTIGKHNIPLKENDLKIVYDREELRLSISAKYSVKVEFPKYTHTLHFAPSAEHQTTPP
ncbi:MAG: hypothetical protein ACMUIU_10310 [bacterium]